MFAPLPIFALPRGATVAPPPTRVTRPLVDESGFSMDMASLTGDPVSQVPYATALRGMFPLGIMKYMRNNTYGISFATGAYPTWTSTAVSYWTDMYRRAPPGDFSDGRVQIIEILAAMNYAGIGPTTAPFGRTADKVRVPDAANTWRTHIRWRHRVLLSDQVGTAGTQADRDAVKVTNARVAGVMGPNEIDAHQNWKRFYLAPHEITTSTPQASITIVDTVFNGNLSLLFLRICDHMRYSYEAVNDQLGSGAAGRTDVAVYAPSIIRTSQTPGGQNFTAYDFFNYEDTSGPVGLRKGDWLQWCDAMQVHQHLNHSITENPWAADPLADVRPTVSPYHWWRAKLDNEAYRAGLGLPLLQRPLINGEGGVPVQGDGVNVAGRNDLTELRRLKFCMLAAGNLHYGISLQLFFTAGLSNAYGYNLLHYGNLRSVLTYSVDPANRGTGYTLNSIYSLNYGSGDDVRATFKVTGIASAGATVTVFGNQTPALQTIPAAAITVGTRFFSDVAGNITAIRFYKGTGTTGGNAHTVALYNMAGTVLASKASAGETASGWQTVTFDSPVAIAANTSYVAATFFPTGGFPRTTNLLTAAIDNAPLHTYATGGRYNNTAGALAFPAASNNNGYFVDPLLQLAAGVSTGAITAVQVVYTGYLNSQPPANVPLAAPVGGTAARLNLTWENPPRFTRVGTADAVTPPVTPPPDGGGSTGAPAPAVAAGLNTQFLLDHFSPMNIYDPTTNPNGTWRNLDFYESPYQAGRTDFAGVRTFCVNQQVGGGMPAGHAHPEWGNAAARATMLPYLPLSQIDNTTMRIACRRARLNERPALRTLINSITTISQSQPADAVTWLGAFLTTERFSFDTRYDIARPAYIACRFRFLPANIPGIFSSFWVYSAGTESHPAGDGKTQVEIDIFETNDLTPTLWKTNFHHQQSGGIKFSLTHNSAWNDGNWHTVGMLWEPNRIRIYRDDVLSGETTGADTDFFNVPMRIMITHTCDPYWIAANPAVLSVPSGVEEVFMDIDKIEVWRAGTAPPPDPDPDPSSILTTGNVSEDLWDDLILHYCTQHAHPNPRIIKCQAKWESDQTFDIFCTSSDSPCGVYPGWTSLESRSFGLLQVTPACGESGGGRMLLANGHPNMTTSQSSPLWGGSVYNPSLNLDIGIHAIAEGYEYFKAQFPGCTQLQHVLMAAAGYVGNWEDVTGCGVWTSQLQIQYVQNVLRIYQEWWGPI